MSTRVVLKLWLWPTRVVEVQSRGLHSSVRVYELQVARQTNRDSFPGRGKRCTSSPHGRDRPWHQLSLLFGWHWGARHGRAADRTPASGAEVKRAWGCTVYKGSFTGNEGRMYGDRRHVCVIPTLRVPTVTFVRCFFDVCDRSGNERARASAAWSGRIVLQYSWEQNAFSERHWENHVRFRVKRSYSDQL